MKPRVSGQISVFHLFHRFYFEVNDFFSFDMDFGAEDSVGKGISPFRDMQVGGNDGMATCRRSLTAIMKVIGNS
jgi:hypothetical protein